MSIPIDDKITDRYYQKEAIRAVFGQIEQGFLKHLLVMATGTGKTRTASSLTDVDVYKRQASNSSAAVAKGTILTNGTGGKSEDVSSVTSAPRSIQARATDVYKRQVKAGQQPGRAQLKQQHQHHGTAAEHRAAHRDGRS